MRTWFRGGFCIDCLWRITHTHTHTRTRTHTHTHTHTHAHTHTHTHTHNSSPDKDKKRVEAEAGQSLIDETRKKIWVTSCKCENACTWTRVWHHHSWRRECFAPKRTGRRGSSVSRVLEPPETHGAEGWPEGSRGVASFAHWHHVKLTENRSLWKYDQCVFLETSAGLRRKS